MNYPYTESELLKIASRFNKHLKEHIHDLKGHSSELDHDLCSDSKLLFMNQE